MSTTRLPRIERRSFIGRTLAGTAVMLGGTWALVALTRGHVPSAAEVWAAAGLSSAATLIVASLFVRETPYPRVPSVLSAFLLAGATLLTAAYPVDPSRWARETREIAWLFPWFFVSIHSGTPRMVRACTTAKARWLLPLSASLLALAIHLPFLLDRL